MTYAPIPQLSLTVSKQSKLRILKNMTLCHSVLCFVQTIKYELSEEWKAEIISNMDMMLFTLLFTSIT